MFLSVPLLIFVNRNRILKSPEEDREIGRVSAEPEGHKINGMVKKNSTSEIFNFPNVNKNLLSHSPPVS